MHLFFVCNDYIHISIYEIINNTFIHILRVLDSRTSAPRIYDLDLSRDHCHLQC